MGAIQNSLNNILTSTLGAAYGYMQTPGARKRAAYREANKRAALMTEAFEQVQGGLNEATATYIEESTKPEAEKEPDKAAEAKAKVDTGLKTLDEATESAYSERIASATKPEQVAEAMQKRITNQGLIAGLATDIEHRQQAAQEAKSGVQNAVPDRKAILEELSAKGINVDNPAVRVRGVK